MEDQFTVTLEGRRPWDFTIQGGADLSSPLSLFEGQPLLCKRPHVVFENHFPSAYKWLARAALTPSALRQFIFIVLHAAMTLSQSQTLPSFFVFTNFTNFAGTETSDDRLISYS